MPDPSLLRKTFEKSRLKPWVDELLLQTTRAFNEREHGDFQRWRAALEQLPAVIPSTLELNADTIKIGAPQDCPEDQLQEIEVLLREFHPWRKGPFELFGIKINTEWRSDWKWNRLKDHIEPLHGRLVLDVGCGSGYHCLRMHGAGAELVVGLEPSLLYLLQFQALQRFIKQTAVHLLPLAMEEIPPKMNAFDSVFSMGLLYHRRSPFDHLFELREVLRPGGQLILETLVVDGKKGEILVPQKRYAKMRNVWFIPSTAELAGWLERSGYHNISCIDITKTSPAEQRATDWMTFESLHDFLDPKNRELTIEGYPAPLRAIFLATK